MTRVLGLVFLILLLLAGAFALSPAHGESAPEVIRATAPGGQDGDKPSADRAPEKSAEAPPDLAKANLKLRVGENIVYDIRVNGMPAGKASMDVSKLDTMEPNGGASVWIVSLNIRSNRAYSLFYDVRDRAAAKIDVNGGFSRFAHIDKKDGDVKDEEFVHFNYDVKTMSANYERRRFSDNLLRSHAIPLPGNVLDPLSAIYYLRSLDLSKFKENDVISLPVCTDRRVWNLQLQVVKRGSADFGDLKNRSYVEIYADPPFKGLFEKKSRLDVYIDSQTGVPLRMNVEIPIGSAEVEISEHTKSPFEPPDEDEK